MNTPMTDSKPDEQFWDLADSFINLANEHCSAVPRSRVSATLLYAAARFNAFVVASNTTNQEQLASEKEEAIAYFLGEYEKMLRANLNDNEKNYAQYIVKSA